LVACFYYEAATKSLYCMLPDRSSPNEHEMEAGVLDLLLDGEGRKLSSSYGFEAHGMTGDPRWKSTDAGDFRLEADSPARGKGWQSR
jgi:hypothetical protein